MQITIDNQPVNVAQGQTILDAARSAGVDIPTLCYREQNNCRITPASCQVCLVRLNGRQFVPSCAIKAEDGMVIESECDEVRQLRKTALELLLSEHYGDCIAPCQLACPRGFDIPKMIRAVQRNDWAEAEQVINQSAADCGTCQKPCEKVCRRKSLDKNVAIHKLMSKVAANIQQNEPNPVNPAKPHWSVKRNKPTKEYLQTMENFAAQLRKLQNTSSQKLEQKAEQESEQGLERGALAPCTDNEFADNEFILEANRCLRCDCLGREKCSLLRYAALYKAETRRFSGSTPAVGIPENAPPVVSGRIVFEADKCIRCGACIAVAEKNGEDTGLSFIGRGCDVKIGVPFERPLETALKHSASEAAIMCPTGALNVITLGG